MRGRKHRRPAELRQVAARLKRLSHQSGPKIDAEAELRDRVREYIGRYGRFGIDDSFLGAVHDVIDSHVVDMEADIARLHMAEEVQLGEVEAELAGLAKGYEEAERSQRGAVDHQSYRRYSALRRIEQRDTPTPAGPYGLEEPGYQHGNPGELAGRRRWGLIVLWVVLVLAMIGDIITFRQVVERVVNESFVFPLVVALTGTTTYIAHRAGEAFKAAQENLRRAVGGWALSAVWLGMGIGAFVFRLLAPAPASGSSIADFINASTSSAASGSAGLSATLMLLLYLLTGAIALAAGYQRPRLEIWQFKQADKAIRKAEPRLATLRQNIAEAEVLARQLRDLRDRRKRQYQAECSRCQAAARRLRAEALMIARRPTGSRRWTWWRRVAGDRADRPEHQPVGDPAEDAGPTEATERTEATEVVDTDPAEAGDQRPSGARPAPRSLAELLPVPDTDETAST